MPSPWSIFAILFIGAIIGMGTTATFFQASGADFSTAEPTFEMEQPTLVHAPPRTAVRYELLVPYSERREVIQQLEALDLQFQTEVVHLDAEGNHMQGPYRKFIFDDPTAQDDEIRAMIENLRRSSPPPPSFIHLQVYEVSYNEYQQED